MAFKINQLNSGRYTGTLRDESGVLFSALDSLTLTLYDKKTAEIINGRNYQDALNTNQVTVYDTLQSGFDDAGNPITFNLRWNLLPEDNPILNDSKAVVTEEHVALFVAIWSGGARQMNNQFSIFVKNLGLLPEGTDNP